MILYPTTYTYNNPLHISPDGICAYLGAGACGGSAGGPSPVSRSRRIKINTPIEDSYCALLTSFMCIPASSHVHIWVMILHDIDPPFPQSFPCLKGVQFWNGGTIRHEKEVVNTESTHRI